MQVLIALFALAAAAFAAAPASVPAAAPAPPPGWQPSGRLLFLPARLENNTPSTQQERESQAEEAPSAKLLDSGEYFVLLPDGRLQMVKYTTAALAVEAASSQQQQQQQQYRSAAPAEPSASQPQQFLFPFPPESSNLQKSQQVKQQQVEAAAPVYHVQYAQFPLEGSRYTQGKLELKEEPKRSEQQQQAEEAEGFEANVQYRDVKPISGPIYAYNPTPLVRVLRHI